MIETPNAIFLHLPKTGGSWISRILKPINIHSAETTHEFLKEPRVDKKVFAFVRNPWDWHKSQYLDDFHGTEIETNKSNTMQLVQPPVKTFADFVMTFTNPSPEFFENVIRVNRVRTLMKSTGLDPFEIEFINSWKESKKGAYQNMCDVFTQHADYVGRYENLREDLLKVLAMSGDLTDEIEHSILNSSKVNYTQSIDYRELYTTELKEIVQLSCQEMIDKYNYTF